MSKFGGGSLVTDVAVASDKDPLDLNECRRGRRGRRGPTEVLPKVEADPSTVQSLLFCVIVCIFNHCPYLGKVVLDKDGQSQHPIG